MPSSAGMPKLPRQETKLSATPARSGGVISGTHDRADHAQRLRPAGERRLEKLVRQRAQSGAQREEHERRVLDAQHQDDSSRRVQRIAAAERRRDAQHLEQRARRSEHLQPRERHDLRRQHQRHHEAEDERVAAADVGQRHRAARRRPRARRRAPSRRKQSRGCAPSPSTSRCSTARGARLRRTNSPPGITPSSTSRASGSTERRATTPINPHRSA